jgi:hypothetical protein
MILLLYTAHSPSKFLFSPPLLYCHRFCYTPSWTIQASIEHGEQILDDKRTNKRTSKMLLYNILFFFFEHKKF